MDEHNTNDKKSSVQVHGYSGPWKSDHKKMPFLLEILYVCTGHCKHEVNEQVYEMEEGDLLLMGDGCAHQMLEASATFLTITLNYNELCASLPEVKKLLATFEIAGKYRLSKVNKGVLVKLRGRDLLTVQDILVELLDAKAKTQEFFTALLFANVIRLFLQLINALTNPPVQTITAQREQIRRQKVLDCLKFISAHFREQLKVDEMAKEADMCRTYFFRSFKEVTGMTFIQYVTKVRIKHACLLLADKNYSINEISSSVGFSHLSHFYQAFKKELGLSPHKYRKMLATPSEFKNLKSAPPTIAIGPRKLTTD